MESPSLWIVGSALIDCPTQICQDFVEFVDRPQKLRWLYEELVYVVVLVNID